MATALKTTNLVLPSGKEVFISSGIPYKEVFGNFPTPAHFRTTLKNHEARKQRLVSNEYKRINERTYDERMYFSELNKLDFIKFMASISVNNRGIIKTY